MTGTFNFEFEELPALIEGGWQCGLLSGQAEIEYSRDGSWSIRAIGLDGYRTLFYSMEERMVAKLKGQTLKAYERKTVWLDAGTPIYLMIYERLEVEWADKVRDEVREHIAEDRDDAAELNLIDYHMSHQAAE